MHMLSFNGNTQCVRELIGVAVHIVSSRATRCRETTLLFDRDETTVDRLTGDSTAGEGGESIDCCSLHFTYFDMIEVGKGSCDGMRRCDGGGEGMGRADEDEDVCRSFASARWKWGATTAAAAKQSADAPVSLCCSENE